MAGVKSHATVEAAPLKSCIVVKEGSSYSEKVSQYLESSCGQNGQGGVSVETVEEDSSDSGDSLFITQKPVPIPVRSTRGRPNLRSDTRPPRDLDEDEDDSSSSSSPERRFEIPATQKEKRMKTKLPEYSFPFLTGKRYRRSGRGTREQNRGLHNAGIAGFFREMWEAHKRGEDVELSLPTVDTDGEDISPLSEEEEERSEDEDIKVVERKVFAVPLKIKNQQTWCDHLKQKSIRKAADARQERSQGEQRKAFNEKQAEANTSRNIEEEDEEEVVPRNIESSSEQPETLGTDRVQEGGQEEEDTSHLQQKMIRRTTQEVIENSESDLGSEDSASSNAEKVVKEKKKRKSIEEDEEQPQSSEKAKNKTKGKREDEIVRSEERREEGEESTATSQEMRISHFIQRNKPLSFSDDATYEEESEGASSFVALDEHMERSPKQRKTRMRTDSEEVDNSLDLFGNENVENTDDTQRKAEDDQMATKKKTKEGLESESFSDKEAELDAAQGDDSASVQQRKRSSSFLGADAESLQSVETPVDGAGRPGDTAGHLDTESAEMYRNEEECVEEVRKGENRERLEIQDRGDKDQEQEFGEPNTTCHTAPSERTAPEQKGVGKGSGSDTESLRTVEIVESTVDARLPSTDDSLVLKEKKKKRKKNTLEFQDRVDTDQEQEFGEPNTTCLRISKRSGSDTDSLRTVEIVANAGLSSTDEAVVLKKKKKKKREMLEIQDGVDKEQAFGEPITTCLSASPGRTAPELKGIGERLGSDTESLRAIESIESSIDVGLHSTDGSVVLNKKKKKRKKREMLDIQDGVEEEREFGELNTTCLSASPVRTEPEVKGKSKGSGSYTGSLRTVESVKSALDAGLSSTDEAVVLKKKKKKKKREMLEIQDSVNKEQAQEFEEPNATCLKSSPERTAPEQKGKSMRSGSDPGSPTTVKSVESVVDAGLPSTDDSVVLNEKKKKRKKRKMLDIQDSVDKDQEFTEPNTTCLIASPERTEAELKRMSKCSGSYTESVRTERVESVVDAGIPSADEAVVLKKKKKKKKRESSEIQDAVDKNQEQDFGEQNATCYTALHERSEPEQKGISKRSGNETESMRTVESVVSAVDAGPPSTDDSAVLKGKLKKRKKREMLEIQDRVDTDQEQEFGEPNTIFHTALREGIAPEQKGTSKHGSLRTEESVKSAVDAGPPSTDEAVVLKKKKKKKKREMLEIQDGVDKDQEQEFGELNTTCLSASHERSEPELKGISRHLGSDNKSLRTVETSGSTVDAGLPLTDEAVVLKKKKKKKREMLEIQDKEQHFKEPNTTCHTSSPERTAPKQKGKRKCSGSDSELLKTVQNVESAVDISLASMDDAVVLKKMKKRKKREMLEIQDRADKGQEQEFGEPNTTFQTASPERTEKELKGKSKHLGVDTESLRTVESVESAIDVALASMDNSVALKKKKKKKKREVFENQDRVDKGQEQEFEKPDTTRHTASPERTEAEQKIRKHSGRETESLRAMESLEDAVDAGIPSTDEAVVLKEKKKKKKNRQMLEIQDRVDKDQEQEFGEPITTCLSVSHERSDPELKKIRKRSRSDTKSLRAMESLESAANAGLSSTDEAVVLKRKKKKKREMLEIQHRVDKDLEQEFAEPNTTCLSVSHERSEPEVKRKRKRLGSDTELLKAVESIESAVDAGLPSTDEAAVLKKKKKKKKSKD